MFSEMIDLEASKKDGYLLIQNHGLITSNRTAALVGSNGTIDWACLPKFDSNPVFSSILDSKKGGFFSIRMSNLKGVRTFQSYKDSTNILVTEFIRDGKPRLRLTDFIPTSEYPTVNFPEIHRYVEAPNGDVRVRLDLHPIFDFARKKPSIDKTISGYIFRADGESVALACDVPLKVSEDYVTSSFLLRSHASKWFVLLHGVKNVMKITDYKSYERMEETSDYWKNWISQCMYHGVYSQHVIRSALVLKGLFYEPTGLMVAAPTTSLPEEIGCNRNWDYRYTWVRDTAYVMEALSLLGYKKEATKFLYDIMEQIERENKIRTIYPIDGTSSMEEKEIDFDGYLHSKPVRIGNTASQQLQIDEYGSIVMAIYYFARIGGIVNSYLWNFVIGVLQRLGTLWKQPDSTIWEFRTEPRHYVYSKLMAWAAFDRAILMGKTLRLSGPYDAWKQSAREIKKAIMANGLDSTGTYLTQYFGTDEVDGAMLRTPLLRILPVNDKIVTGTMEKIEEELMTKDYLFRRYKTDDGFSCKDNAFLLLSFWYVEDLVLMGKLRKAREVFESLLQKGNHLNLFSEEVDLETGHMLGNFPQALTHIGVIRAATRLSNAYKQRLGNRVSRHNY